MKNLKRALSLGLTATMLSGMMVAGAGAASYADVTSANNEKAIDVLKAVGVMTGDDKGNFNPDQKVTRAEMAVIMANMLDLDVDNFGSASIPFTDVPSWAVPYVAACYADGITSGTSATTYGSNDTVTTVQAALMMMKALGYFQYASDFGADWSLATIRQASSIGLFDGIKAGSKDAMTRDEVAQLSLNTLEATMVQANKTGSDINLGNGVIISGGVTYDEVTSGSDYAKAMSQEKKDGNYTVQLGEKLYDGNLKVKSSTYDDFGRPSEQWSYKTTEIGNYAKTADASYTGEVKAKDLYTDLGLSETTKANLTEDGKSQNNFTVAKGDSKVLPGSGNGTITEAYVDDNGNVDIAVINVYGSEVTKVVDAKDGDAAYIKISGESDEYEAEGFKVDDVVYYTKAGNEIKSVVKAGVTEGVTVTRVSGSEFTADGTTYKMNKTAGDAKANDIAVDSILDVYTDGNGFVIDVEVSKASKDYAYVLGLKNDGYEGDHTTTAKLLLADGTVTEVTLADALDKEGQKPEDVDFDTYMNKVVKYTKNSKDEYKLNADEVATVNGTGAEVNIEKGKAAMKLGADTYYANSKTVFLVKSNDSTYTSYTGYENVPNLKGDNGKFSVYTTTENGNVASVVYVENVATSSDDVLYVLSSKEGTYVNDSKAGEYYEYKAVLNGELTTVKMDDEIKGGMDKLFNSIAYSDKENEILDTSACLYTADEDNYAVTAKVTDRVKDGVIGLDDKFYTISKDVQVFAVYNGDKIESSSTSDIEVNDEAMVIIKNGEVTTIFYGEEVGGEKPSGDAVVEKVELGDWTVGGQPVGMGAVVTFDKEPQNGDTFRAELEIRENGQWNVLGTYELEYSNVAKADGQFKAFWSFADEMTNGGIFRLTVEGMQSNIYNAG